MGCLDIHKMKAVPRLIYKYVTRSEGFDYKGSKFSWATYQIK